MSSENIYVHMPYILISIDGNFLKITGMEDEKSGKLDKIEKKIEIDCL